MTETKQFDPQKFKCRCSAISRMFAGSRSNPVLSEKQAIRLQELEDKVILTDKMKEEMAELIVKRENGTKVILSDGCIDYLLEWYAWETEGMIKVSKEAMEIAACEKGKSQEEDSIDLLSVVEGIVYRKNDARVENEYLSGIPDIFIGDNIMQALKITDIKSIWDYPTFLRKTLEPLENGYEDQIRGYMDITSAPEGELARCLVSMSEEMINDYKYRLAMRMGATTTESPEFLKTWETWERSMRFDHIPSHKRVVKIKIDPFPDEKRQKLYDIVKICREWLSKFHEEYQKINK